MKSANGPIKASLLSAAFCLALGAFAAAPAHADGLYVGVAPPQARVEVIGVAPAPGYFWVGGYWGWVGGRHEWIGGHWEAPRAGYRWVPHNWAHEDRGWRPHEGHWERR